LPNKSQNKCKNNTKLKYIITTSKPIASNAQSLCELPAMSSNVHTNASRIFRNRPTYTLTNASLQMLLSILSIAQYCRCDKLIINLWIRTSMLSA
jgi:hypothetical protein